MLKGILRRLEWHYRRGGVRQALWVCVSTPYYMVRYYPRRMRTLAVRRRNLAFDRAYGVDTATPIKIGALDVDGTSWLYGSSYEAVSDRDLFEIVSLLKIEHSEYTFIDLGSGKGKALLLASDYPFRRIIGVEFSQQLHEVAVQNIAQYKKDTQLCRDIRSVCADAMTYELPDESMVVFLANPFGVEVMSVVVERLEALLKSGQRKIFVAYLFPLNRAPFDRSPMFQEVASSDRPAGGVVVYEGRDGRQTTS
jgi:SAM-dependent methyltransferase